MPATRHAFLVALTGYGSKTDHERASEAGFDRYFVKPADPRALTDAIADWLRTSEAGTLVLPSRDIVTVRP